MSHSMKQIGHCWAHTIYYLARGWVYCQSNIFGLHWPEQQTSSVEIETGDPIKRRWQRAHFIRLHSMEQRFHTYSHSLHFKFHSSRHETTTSQVTCSLSQDWARRRGQVTAPLSDLAQKQNRPAFFRTFSSWLFPLQNENKQFKGKFKLAYWGQFIIYEMEIRILDDWTH